MKVQKDDEFAFASEEISEIRKEYNAWLKAAEKLHNTCWYIKMRCDNSATIPESLATEIRSSIKQLVMVLSWFDSEGGLEVINDHKFRPA